jgi:predicted ribosome quality control (RQC) complex YloA/Tae2 family protein
VQDWPARVLEAALPPHATAADYVAWLRAHFTGVSPVVARALQSTLHHTEPVAATHFAIACAAFFHNVKKAASEEITPALCGEQPYPFAFAHDCAPQQSTFSALIEQCVQREAAAQILAGFRARLLAHLASGLKRNAAQQQDAAKALRHAEDAALYNAQGQAIWAHIPQVEEALQHGATSIELPLDAWTTEDANTAGTTHIALEPKWSAADNATRCFNRYRRAQKLATDAPARVQELADEAARLHAWEEAARAAAQREELEAIARASGLYDKTQQREDKTVSRTRQESEAARPENKLRRREFEGWQFYMGRNALENQMLLSKVASPSDVWMHVRGMASAHVLIKNQKGRQPPPRVLEEAAAWLAATTRTGSGRATARGDSATRDGGPRDSAARDASTRRQASEHATDAGERLEIIYTQAKWVRAVRGAPGRVTLQRFETLLVQV